MGEGDEPLPTQDKEEVPVGEKTIGDEAVPEEDRKEKKKKRALRKKIARNTSHTKEIMCKGVGRGGRV